MTSPVFRAEERLSPIAAERDHSRKRKGIGKTSTAYRLDANFDSSEQSMLYKRIRRDVPFSVLASAVPLVPQDQRSRPQSIPKSPSFPQKAITMLSSVLSKCLWLAFAGAGAQLEQAIDGKSEFGSLSQEAIFSQACKQDSLVWFVDIVLCAGVLFLLGWSLQYTVPAVLSIFMYRQMRNLLCPMKRKLSQAQAIMFTTVSYFIFWQAISVAWSTAASTTLNLNYPLYQGTARLPLAIASWIYQQEAIITCLNILVCNTAYLNCNRMYADCLVARPKYRGDFAREIRPCSGAFA